MPDGLFFRARREVLVNLARVAEIRPYFKSSFLLTISRGIEVSGLLGRERARLDLAG